MQAEDTGRVLLVQRLPDKHDEDEAYARWEFPGGRLDDSDASVWAGAVREFEEETGCPLPASVEPSGGWTSDDGVYEGFVLQVARESMLVPHPQPDEISRVQWWDPADLDDPRIREKVTEQLGDIKPLLKSFHRHTDAILAHYTPLIQDSMAQIIEGDTVRHAIRAAYTSVHKATAGTHSKRSGMVSLDVPAGLIPVMAGGVPDQHITVVFLGSDVGDATFAAVCALAETVAASVSGPVSGTIGGLGTFPPSESSDWLVPVWAKPEIVGIAQLRAPFEPWNASQHKDFHPHMTLAYLDPDEPLPAPVPPTPVTFTHLSVHRGDEVVRFPFGGAVKAMTPTAPGSQNTPKYQRQLQALISSPQTVIGAAGVGAGAALAGPALATAGGVGSAVLALLNAQLKLGALTAVLTALYGDALLQGAYEASQASGKPLPPLGLPEGYWDQWVPGHNDLAAQLPGGTLQELLAAQGVTIRGISETQLNRIADAIAEAVRDGVPMKTTVVKIEAIIGDAARAQLIASTEYARAVTAARRAFYRANHIGMVAWIAHPDACELCKENEAVSPRALRDSWPNGEPPVHPACRCVLAPAP